MTDAADLEAKARALEETGCYRVLRKLGSPLFTTEPFSSDNKLAVFVDVETTGLEPSKDEIIEIALIRFRYSTEGTITSIVDAFDQLREPSFPIPEVATGITGITNEMVAGCRIDEEAVEEIVASADLVIAHNALFDRRFLERLFPIFASKAWACSMSEIDWAGEGFEGTKLTYLAAETGFFYDRHRAENDCFASIELLRRKLPKSGETGLAALLRRARQTTWRIWAEGAPFELKDVLKARGYRWNAEEREGPRAWYFDALEEQKEAEIAFLKDEIYRVEKQVRITKITAFDRYSDRV
ncbi:MAG: DNA polymerase III subunit epsilon [Hyphomonas sp. BRH_c22]|uniref:3'-5' exonuclease n=1 Tax=Hyphomonas sp. BRH_c22 TaxID=1629710 RepID=UPI0005F17957|nr:3'-5' exonuclease [Hyphomonas sp. BRH_c22]KJS37659.1 MAG: DNA polymerase III subunit epsilon [Hyphomonas sp. BRH_c22]